MKKRKNEMIFILFNYEEIERAEEIKKNYINKGFSLISEYKPTSKKDGEGYFDLRLICEFIRI